MATIFSDRIQAVPPSFIRSILKVAANPDVISFAGGLPNPVSFPQAELAASMERVVATVGDAAFQYGLTAGVPELRELMAERYNRRLGTDFTADDVLVTTGSQQALDLLGKVLINPGDAVVVEKPSYLGALQAFCQYGPSFAPVTLGQDGLDPQELDRAMERDPKLVYLVPDFQNPTGMSYTAAARERVYEALRGRSAVLVEDDPYGELRFEGERLGSIGAGRLEGSVLLGTVSKVLSPGLRLGFAITRNRELMAKLCLAKEASDLHTSTLAQYLAWDYLARNDQEAHIARIRELYRRQCQAMLDAMERHLPSSVTWTRPQGGMFVWATLPAGASALDLVPKALERKVAFVPGDSFYVDERNVNAMRLNYTNASEEAIDEGVRRLGEVLREAGL